MDPAGGPGDAVGVGGREPLGCPHPDEGEFYDLPRNEAGGPWREVTENLPETKGRVASILAASDAEFSVFYALTNLGLYR